jgi:hypothetical protein
MPSLGMHDFYAEDPNDTPQDLSGLYGNVNNPDDNNNNNSAAATKKGGGGGGGSGGGGGGGNKNHMSPPPYYGSPGVQSNALLTTHKNEFQSNDFGFSERGGYNEALETGNLPDFGDTCGVAVKSMTEHPSLRQRSSQRFMGSAVPDDEFQSAVYGMTAAAAASSSSQHAHRHHPFAAKDEEDDGNNLSPEGVQHYRVYGGSNHHNTSDAQQHHHQQHVTPSHHNSPGIDDLYHHHQEGYSRKNNKKGSGGGGGGFRASTFAMIGIVLAIALFAVLHSKRNVG